METIKIKDIHTALQVFEDAAARQAEATKTGDYKTGNKRCADIAKAVAFLRKENALDQLFALCSAPAIGTRLWAASYILSTHEKEGIETLEEIIKGGGIIGFTADITLSEWRKGTLKMSM